MLVYHKVWHKAWHISRGITILTSPSQKPSGRTGSSFLCILELSVLEAGTLGSNN